MRSRQSTEPTGSHPCSVPSLSPFPTNSCDGGFKAFPEELSSCPYQIGSRSQSVTPISKPLFSIDVVFPQAGQVTTLLAFQLALWLTTDLQTSYQTLSHLILRATL